MIRYLKCVVSDQILIYENQPLSPPPVATQPTPLTPQVSPYECWKLEAGHVANSRALPILEILPFFPAQIVMIRLRNYDNDIRYHQEKAIVIMIGLCRETRQSIARTRAPSQRVRWIALIWTALCNLLAQCNVFNQAGRAGADA